MKVEQAHDHRVLHVAGLWSNPAYDPPRWSFGCVTLLGGGGVALSMVGLGLTQTGGGPAWTHTSEWGLGMQAGLVGSGLVAFLGIALEQIRAMRRGPTVTIRVGASWVQIGDGPRVAFDTVTLLQTEPGVLVVASEHTATVPDPDGEVHDELSRALDAWQTRETADGDGSVAARQQKRLQSLTQHVDDG